MLPSTCTTGRSARPPRPASAWSALDNGLASCDDPAALQATCDSFGAHEVKAFVDKWLARLPRPLTDDDRAAGYDYDISVLQAELSLTQVLDRPLAGRVLFEEVIRDNLDAGRRRAGLARPRPPGP